MTKLKKLQQNVKDLPKKKKDQGAIGKIVKKKATALTQKKKETIVQDIISKKDDLKDQVTLKKEKNKIKLNLKQEKQKPTGVLKKSKSAPKLALVPKEKKHEPPVVTKKDKSKDKPAVGLKEKKHELPAVTKKSKNKDKLTTGLKEKKIKSTVIAKKNKTVVAAVTNEEKSKIKKISKKNKGKSKQLLAPEKEIITKVLTKKEKSNLKQVLVPREEKNVAEVVSKKNKNKAKLNVPAKDEKIVTKTISKKAKRKAESVLQKENTVPEVAVKKAKVLKDVNTKKNKATVEKPVSVKEGKKSQDLPTKKKKNVGKDSLKRKNLEHYVKAVLKVAETGEQKRKILFNADRPPLFLMITCMKIPKTPLYQMRMDLPHSMVTPDDDVALFVSDLKRGRKRSPDDTVHHYQDVLESHKCNRIKTIVPLNQVKTDYRQFEMRRKLLGTHDYFLCDGRISGHLAHLLGKTFRAHRKMPTSIHMNKKNLKAEIERGLTRTSLQIHSTGDTYVTQFATCSMSVDNIIDNLLAVVQELSNKFPGGWNNIRALRIKSPLSLAIPIYMTLKNKNEVEVPVVEPKRPKAYESVEGELSTFNSNVNVTVAPDGTVHVVNLGNDSDEDENPDDIEEEGDAENEIKDEDEEEEEDEEDEEEENDDEDEDEEDEDENESDG